MSGTERIFLHSLVEFEAMASSFTLQPAEVRRLADGDLLASQRALAEIRRVADASAALIAGEIAHRSRRELGYDGLAQREGFRTAEKLVQHETGSTARDASTLVTVGTLIHDAHPAPTRDGDTCEAGEPWLVAVGAAVAFGSLTPQAAQAIRTGLGAPNDDVPQKMLATAVLTLLAEAGSLNVDTILVRARQLRDDMDLAGVALREQQIRDARSISRVRRANGLNRYIVDPDIEATAFWDDLYDRVTAPRRGNVTFLSAEDQAWAESASGRSGTDDRTGHRTDDRTDDRTVDQYVHDTFTDLLRIAVATGTAPGMGMGTGTLDARRIVGSRGPSVRVLVTVDALDSGIGIGHVEGINAPISLATVERIACTNGTITATFDSHGNGIDLGREQRLFTARQRIILSTRDGGCRMPGCDRPPSWCEAHHIDHWKRDHGPTNLDRGVLLCRHHHLLIHNNNWEIKHDSTGYWLIPPTSIDPEQLPRPMPSKSAVMLDLHALARA